MSRVGERLLNIGIMLSAIGVMILIADLIVNSLQASSSGTASLGGVVLIGPIPIIFGTDRIALLICIIGALILAAISFTIYYTGMRRAAGQADSVV